MAKTPFETPSGCSACGLPWSDHGQSPTVLICIDLLKTALGDLEDRYDRAMRTKTVHQWLAKKYPKTGCCEHCGCTDKPTDYASIGHTYTRERADWLELCRPCHRKFDGHGAKVAATKRGKPLSAEHRRSLSIAAQTRVRTPLSDSHRAAVSAALMGHPGVQHTPETRAQMSESHKGIPVTSEARAKIAAAARQRWSDPEFRARMKPAMKAGWTKRRRNEGGDAL